MPKPLSSSPSELDSAFVWPGGRPRTQLALEFERVNAGNFSSSLKCSRDGLYDLPRREDGQVSFRI